MEVLNAGEICLSERRRIVQGEIRLRDGVDSKGITCFLLPTFSFILKEKEPAWTQDCKSVFQENLTFECLLSVLDFDRAFENDSLVGVHLARAQIRSAAGHCVGA